MECTICLSAHTYQPLKTPVKEIVKVLNLKKYQYKSLVHNVQSKAKATQPFFNSVIGTSIIKKGYISSMLYT